MKTHSPRSRRPVVEVAELEARRLFCLEGAHAGLDLSHMPLASDEINVAQTQSAGSNPDAAAGGINTLIVPAYSSRPGALHKLFLDFNGHGAIDNWGGWWEFGGHTAGPTPAYDIDGDSGSFTDLELAKIHNIWKGVAEKFSPFDIDVTTVQPSSAQFYFSGRVAIGGDGSWYDGGGGVALRGSFGGFGHNTSFVWANQANTTYVAEAIAHEAGHMLDLKHHSLAPISVNEYAPGYIMGAGDAGIGRWANTSVHGTIATTRDDDGVHNEGSQNDLSLLLGNGFGYRPDDAGGTTATAVLLPLAFQSGVNQGAASGVIELSNDVDYYRINHTGGSLDVEVLAAEFRRMLDPRITLRNSANAVLASSSSNNGSDAVGERITFNNLDAGTYYVTVAGSGAYGDIGQYRVSARAGLATTAFNDTVGTATRLGAFGNTDAGWLAVGYGGTSIINDSLTSTDSIDFFKFRAPAHTRQVYVQLSGLTTTASLALYDDLNGNGLIDAGETVFATNPGTGVQSFSHNTAVGDKDYYVRVARGTGAPSGNYQLRITADTAPSVLAPTAAAPFDPAPLVGGKVVYESLDQAAGDTVDYYRVVAKENGIFGFYLSNFGNGDVRMDVGFDQSGNGILDPLEIVASHAVPGAGSSEFIETVNINDDQKMLVRISQQSAGSSTNYSLQAIADYATGGNSNGSLANALSLNNAAGSLVEHLRASIDQYDTFRIFPVNGAMTARFTALELGANHRLEIIRDANANNVVDAGEIVASGFTGQTLNHTVTSGANYFLRMQAISGGEFFSLGNYRMTYITAGAVTGATVGAPVNLGTISSAAAIGGYLGFDPADASLTNLDDYYQFTIANRTRFNISTNGSGVGLQIGTFDAQRNFRRTIGVGQNAGAPLNALNVNLDPGTYILRAYQRMGERQDTAVGGQYGLFWSVGAITDNSPPVVTASAFQYEIGPVGVSFTVDQDVLGTVDASDVTIRAIDGAEYPVGSVFYDPASRRLGYGVAGGTLPDGNYTATLKAGSIADRSNNPLAADHSFSFFVFAGDANRDRAVNLADFSVLASRFNTPGTFSQGDFNYDGVADIADFSILASRFNTTLPAARPGNSEVEPPAASHPKLAAAAPATRAPFGSRLIDDVLTAGNAA